MPQAKRKPGKKPTAVAPPPPPAIPANLLVKAFRMAEGQPKKISFLDGPGSAEIKILGSTVDGEGKWKNFDRLVIGSGTATPLVLDVIPDNDAVIKHETNGNNTKSTLSVECQIRCIIGWLNPGALKAGIHLRGASPTLTALGNSRLLILIGLWCRSSHNRLNSHEPWPLAQFSLSNHRFCSLILFRGPFTLKSDLDTLRKGDRVAIVLKICLEQKIPKVYRYRRFWWIPI